jgi:hypothetical protein
MRIFIALKNPSPRPGFEPATFKSSDKHTNQYTTEVNSTLGWVVACLQRSRKKYGGFMKRTTFVELLSLQKCLWNAFAMNTIKDYHESANKDIVKEMGEMIWWLRKTSVRKLNLNSITQLIFVMVKCGVLFEVRTGLLNNI